MHGEKCLNARGAQAYAGACFIRVLQSIHTGTTVKSHMQFRPLQNGARGT